MDSRWKTISKEELEQHVKNGKSILAIAKIYGVDYETVRRRMAKFGIDVNKAPTDVIQKIVDNSTRNIVPEPEKSESKNNYDDHIFLFTNRKVKECSITLVISDLHIGHSDFLPESLHSAFVNLLDKLEIIKKNMEIKSLNVVFNGDIVSGNCVYKNQEFDNIINKWTIQLEVAIELISKLLISLKDFNLNKVYFVLGNHDDNYMDSHTLYLCNALSKKFDCSFVGKLVVLNVGSPLGVYNVLFTHGKGNSEYSPVPPSVIRDISKLVHQYSKDGVNIERISIGHTHWLCTSFEIDGIIFDVCGGFQRWRNSYSCRPCGFLMYLYTKDNCEVIKIRPDKEIEMHEKHDVNLEIKNIEFIGKVLSESESRNDDFCSYDDHNIDT